MGVDLEGCGRWRLREVMGFEEAGARGAGRRGVVEMMFEVEESRGLRGRGGGGKGG
jgi:hypothetical protein